MRISDWSADVCSSDLPHGDDAPAAGRDRSQTLEDPFRDPRDDDEQAADSAPDGEVEPHRIETVGGDDSEEAQEIVPPNRPRRSYKIQEVIKRRQIMLVQVTKEERGNKGAALTTYLSLAGRY